MFETLERKKESQLNDPTKAEVEVPKKQKSSDANLTQIGSDEHFSLLIIIMNSISTVVSSLNARSSIMKRLLIFRRPWASL